MSLATNNIIVGSMGTLVLGLSFKDAAICAILGNLVGVTTIGYMSTWGPRSGNRTLVIFFSFSSFIHGWKQFLSSDGMLNDANGINDRSSHATSWGTIPAKSAVH